MFVLRVLGANELRDAAGNPVDSILAQPSRFAVLAYLGLHAGRLVRRDELLAAFWPHLDEANARNSLSQALHVLRRALGSDAIVSRGADVGVNADLVSCDAVEFMRLAQMSDSETAAAAYSGSLLPAFRMTAAPAFEQWLDTERARLKAIASDVFVAASRAAIARGDNASALRLARRAGNELQDDRGVQLLAELEAGTAPPVARQHGARTGVRVAMALALAGVVAFVAIAVRGRPADAVIPIDASVRVAVLPFGVTGTADQAYLAAGLMDALSIDLDGVGPVRTIDPRAITALITGRDTADRIALGKLAAARLHADRFVLGAVTVNGAQMHFSATLYDSAGHIITVGSADVDHAPQILGATDKLARELLAHELPAPADGLSRLAALTSPSVAAFRHYLEGERFYRDGHFDMAAEAFGAAVQEDSAFAMGNYRLAESLDWGIHRWNGMSQYQYLARAMRHMSPLSQHDQQLMRALDEFWGGRSEQAAAMYRVLIAAHPDNVEAWEELGEVTFHRLTHSGVSLSASRPQFERVLELDPSNANAYVHLARLASLRGDAKATDSLVRRALVLAPTHDAALELGVLTALGSDTPSVRQHAYDALRAEHRLDTRRFDPVWLTGLRVATYRENPEIALQVANILAAPGAARGSLLMGHVLGAHAAASLGRYDDAMRHLDDAARINPDVANEIRTAIALLGPFTMTPARIDALKIKPVSSVIHVPTAPAALSASPIPWEFNKGLVSVISGDSSGVSSAMLALARQERDTGDLAVFPNLRFYLAARRAMSQGRAAEALHLLEPASRRGDASAPNFPRAAERMLRAELLHHLGRFREAIDWYESVPEDLGHGLMYIAPRHLGMARAYDALGDSAHAAREYAIVARVWSNAEGELRNIRDSARVRASAGLGQRP